MAPQHSSAREIHIALSLRPTPTHSRGRALSANLTGGLASTLRTAAGRMAWLAVLSHGATPQSAASAPSTEAEFRAAGDASSAAFESSSDVSKTADVPRQLRNNCTTRRSCAPALVVGLIGAIFFTTVMMAATSSHPPRGLRLQRLVLLVR